MYFASSITWMDTTWRQRFICSRKLEKIIDDLCGHHEDDDDDDDDDDGSHASSQTIRRRHSPSPVERTSVQLWSFRGIWWMISKGFLLSEPFFLFFFSVPLITTGWWIFFVFRKQCLSLQISAWMGKASVLCVCVWPWKVAPPPPCHLPLRVTA